MDERVILLAEDNPQDEALALRALQRAGVTARIDVVRDGQQVLDYLGRRGPYADRAGPDLPTVLLLDIGLPRLSGLEVLQALRANPATKYLPVVMFTSSDEERDRHGSYHGGANSFVRKPLDFLQYMSTVGHLGHYWGGTNEPLGCH